MTSETANVLAELPLPAGWHLLKLKHLCRGGPVYGANLSADTYTNDGLRFIRTTDIDDLGHLSPEGVNVPNSLPEERLIDGDLLLSRSGTIGRSFLYACRHPRTMLLCGISCAILNDTIVQQPVFSFGSRSRRPSWRNWRAMRSKARSPTSTVRSGRERGAVPCPGDAKRRNDIANFLDRETAKIDALIAKQTEFLTLLDEHRRALVTDAVTKGLDPSVPQRVSGSNFLGAVPAHWSVVRLKQRAVVIDCKHTTPTYVPDGYPLLSTTEVKPFSLDLDGPRRVTEQDFRSMTEGGRLPRPGDVIYSRNASVGSAALVTKNMSFCMGQDLCLIRWQGMDPVYATYQLDSMAVTRQVDSLLVGSTIKRINVEQIRNFLIASPPLGEQQEIAEHLQAKTDEFKKATASAVRIIELMQERGSALITAAVTGQIDVTQSAPKLAAA